MIISLAERLFRQNDSSRAQLLDALKLPAVSEALSICMEAPTKEPAFVPGVPLDTTCAHELLKMIGANRVNSALIRMTHPLGKSHEELEQNLEEEPWKYVEDQIQMPPRPVIPPTSPDPAPPFKKKPRKS